MPLIENVPMFAVELGSHRINAKNAYLISITDPKDKKPEIAGKFAEVHYFKFHDLEKIPEDMPDAILMNDADATKIISILNKALAKNYDVVVHCGAGICRSGAVVEAATALGFVPVHNNRIPNLHVKRKLFEKIIEV